MKGLSTFLAIVLMMALQPIAAQTTEELQAMKDEKAAELAELKGELAELTGKVDALKGEVAGLTDQLTPYPRWDTGLLGNVGLNFSTFNDWLLRDQPNTSAVNIGFSSTGFANADFEKAFWRNSLSLTLGWLKFDNRDNPDDNDDFQVSADAFNITSLYGYKLSDKLAISTLGEYRTSILDGRFNNPGYLDLGVGATWTPIKDLVVVVHPLNYNFVFSDAEFDYKSSLGAKIVADYTRQLTKNIAWKSNLSAFASYEGSDLSNWTWVNGLSTAVKGIGIGLDIGLRNNKQEALAAEKTDNPLQTYWILGLSYAISAK
ncbi:DUF3078 domain-containing protein [Lewinella cohaerens]|uniref:DUF3078 domain-containing protein n=1 Tax=Lewinella cohaerens TaxID=70995 RepID=UPI0003660EF1|nr:DUF3078 domain-containing protein [Lewinella cohaerens]